MGNLSQFNKQFNIYGDLFEFKLRFRHLQILTFPVNCSKIHNSVEKAHRGFSF